jgi:hypothetical protein
LPSAPRAGLGLLTAPNYWQAGAAIGAGQGDKGTYKQPGIVGNPTHRGVKVVDPSHVSIRMHAAAPCSRPNAPGSRSHPQHGREPGILS